MDGAISAGSGGLVEQLLLTEQNGRRLVAIVVLSLTALANLGYLSKGEAEILQKANEAVNDAKYDDCEIESKFLRKASEKLRKNITLQTIVVSAIRATINSGFARWEQANTVYITMEPFDMANGHWTQNN
jgi:long-subunit acyl-CoA synthetase (AMP-forming)